MWKPPHFIEFPPCDGLFWERGRIFKFCARRILQTVSSITRDLYNWLFFQSLISWGSEHLIRLPACCFINTVPSLHCICCSYETKRFPVTAVKWMMWFCDSCPHSTPVARLWGLCDALFCARQWLLANGHVHNPPDPQFKLYQSHLVHRWFLSYVPTNCSTSR